MNIQLSFIYLFIFAHRGEAKEFLEDFKPLSHETHESKNKRNPTSQLLERLWMHKLNPQHYTLICGEGVFDALQWTTAALTYFYHQYDLPITVINCGLAGALSPKHEVGTWVFVNRATYCQEDLNWQFATFTSQASKLEENLNIPVKSNIVSFSKRVFDQKLKHFLSTQAEIVDRELWGIAKACQPFQVPWASLKLISDNWSDYDQDLCRNIKSNWKTWSEKIQQQLEQLLQNTSHSNQHHTWSHYFENQFYFTYSMQQQLSKWRSYFESDQSYQSFIIQLKEKILLTHKEYSPKEKGRLALKMIEEVSTPDLTKIKKNLRKILEPFEDQKLKIHPDATFETSKLVFELQTSSQEELEKYLKRLSTWSFQNYQDFIEGKNLS